MILWVWSWNDSQPIRSVQQYKQKRKNTHIVLGPTKRKSTISVHDRLGRGSPCRTWAADSGWVRVTKPKIEMHQFLWMWFKCESFRFRRFKGKWSEYLICDCSAPSESGMCFMLIIWSWEDLIRNVWVQIDISGFSLRVWCLGKSV